MVIVRGMGRLCGVAVMCCFALPVGVAGAQPIQYRPGQEMRTLSTDYYTLSIQKNGRIDLVLANMHELFSNVRPLVWLEGEEAPHEMKIHGKRSYRQEVNTVLGQGQGMVLECDEGQWVIHAYPGKPFLVAQIVYVNTGKKAVRVRSLHPWHAGGDVEGGVNLGTDAAGTRVLAPWPDNGDAAPAVTSAAGEGLWTLAAHNPASGLSILAGYLAYDNARGEFAYHNQSEAPELQMFRADYMFNEPVDVPPGGTLTSGSLYLAVAEVIPQEGLERFAVAVSRANEFEWNDDAPPHAWRTSEQSEGLDAGAEWIARELSPYGWNTAVAESESGAETVVVAGGPFADTRRSPLMYTTGVAAIVSADEAREAVASAARRYFVTPWLGRPLMPPVALGPEAPLSESRRQALLTAFAMLGGVLQISGDPTTFTAADVATLKRILPLAEKPSRPVDLFADETARVFVTALRAPLAESRVLGLFNWSDTADAMHVGLDTLGLAPSEYYAVYDILQDSYVGTASGALSVSVSAGSVSLYCIMPYSTDPRVIGIAHALNMGNQQFEQIAYDRKAKVLSGVLQPRADSTCEFRILAPETASAQSVSVSAGVGTMAQEGRLIRVKISETNLAVTWRIQF